MQGNFIKGSLDLGQLDSRDEKGVLTLDLVSAFAGDRPLIEYERHVLDSLKKNSNGGFYPDVLYAITHQSFPSAIAEELWGDILRHKFELSEAVGRNVGVIVATLDCLSNLKGQLKSTTLIGESHVSDIVRLALRDGLTQLFNHVTCLEKIDVEVRIYQRYGRAASLMMIDIDDFKAINDQYGHQTGDRVLKLFGAGLEKATRGSDICCRYGGEEFAVILPATDIQEAGLLAERLRVKTEQCVPDGRPVTVSIGVASCDKDTSTAQALVEKADVALYLAKRAGKNRVVVSAY